LAVEVTGERGFAVNTASEAENLVAKDSVVKADFAVENLTAVVVSAVKVASEAENHMAEDSVVKVDSAVANLTAVAAGMAENHTAVDIGRRYFN
jgi:hypothetical protein